MVKLSRYANFFLLFIFIKPHFYYYSYYYGRASDLITLFLLFVLFLSSGAFISKKLNKYYILIFVYAFSILLTLFFSSLTNDLGIKDFVDLIRPPTIILSLCLGFSLYEKSYKLSSFINFLVMLGVISGVVAVLQKYLFPDFYKIYSDYNHFVGNRPTGIFYDFAEFSLIQCFAIISAMINYSENRKKINILLSVFFAYTIFLSTSKAGVLLLLLILLWSFLSYFFRTRRSFYTYISTFFIFLLSFYFCYLYVINNELLLRGLTDIFTLNTYNASVGNRLDQMHAVTQQFIKMDYSTIIGNSRLNDRLYIEVAFFATLYRYGILGVFIYYLYFYMLYSEKVLGDYKYFKAIVFSAVLIDIVASMTVRFGFLIIINILFGLLIAKYEGSKRRGEK